MVSVRMTAAVDSLLVRGIAQASNLLLRNQNDSALAMADSLLPLARRPDATVAEASLYQLKAIAYTNKNKKVEAVQEYIRMLEVSDKAHFLENAPNTPFLYQLMLPALVQLAVLTWDMKWKEQSVAISKLGIKWTAQCPDKELAVTSIAAFGAILTECQEYEAAYEPLKQAYDDAVALGRKDHALAVARSLVSAEEHLNPQSPTQNPWIRKGEQLMLDIRKENREHQQSKGEDPWKTDEPPMSVITNSFMATAYKSYVKELAKRDSLMAKGVSDSVASHVPDTVYMSTSRNDSIRHHIQYVRVQNKKAAKIALTVIVVLLLSFSCYAVWQRYVRRKRETRRYVEGLEQERNRLAKELHDGVSNQLLAVEMQLHDENTKGQAMRLLSESREQVRRVSHELLPPEFTYATLDEVIGQYIEELDGANQCDISLHLTPPDADWSTLSPQQALEIYRIVQEAVGNALKHSGATTIAVGMRMDGRKMTVIVSDNGRNNETPQGNTRHIGHSSGIGSRTMRQRATLIGASLEFHVSRYGNTLTLTLRN